MPRHNISFIKSLILAPWWLSVAIAFCAYVFLQAIIPSIQFSNLGVKAVAMAFSGFAHWIGLFFLFIAFCSFLHRFRIDK